MSGAERELTRAVGQGSALGVHTCWGLDPSPFLLLLWG